MAPAQMIDSCLKTETWVELKRILNFYYSIFLLIMTRAENRTTFNYLIFNTSIRRIEYEEIKK